MVVAKYPEFRPGIEDDANIRGQYFSPLPEAGVTLPSGRILLRGQWVACMRGQTREELAPDRPNHHGKLPSSRLKCQRHE